MKKILLLVLILAAAGSKAQIVKFSIIGDYGKAGTNELNVSNLVKSWNPEFVITVGDNNYELGEQSTIDANIGQYYRQFIFPYTGSYGSGDTVNRFFPSLGNHDWYTAGVIPYLNYFTLPGNERYYDFVKGNIHFFCIDSDPNEPDGVDSSSVQALWLKTALSNSASKYNIVFFHHAPYSSGQHGSSVYMQWPFKSWGADIVLTGHDHTYERIVLNNFSYIVNGLGGKSIYTFNTPVAGSLVRYNGNYGAMLANSYNDSLVFKFYSVTPTLRDNFKILPAAKVLSLNIIMEGRYNSVSGKMKGDTVKGILRNKLSPYAKIDSALSYVDSAGNGIFSFSKALNSTDYYIVADHRNSLETWSAAGKKFIINSMNYDFSVDSTRALGNNLIHKGTDYCVISGDVNKDKIIDAGDLSLIDNAIINEISGYVITDLTGDYFVDAEDLGIADNNSSKKAVIITP